ncbi:MAG: hypothetical protein EBT15_12445, partial [Betaproteobacteria bacterium]|nr:hypothetical protein [Betaproteobacteria bacterium]
SPLTDLDEGAFSEATREMLARGDFISPWLLDAPRFDKPVLFHWAQMLGFWLLGQNSWGARLPSALAGLAWIGAIGGWAYCVTRKLSPHRALASYGWAVLISATCIGIPAMARAATADSLLNALMALSLLFAWQALWGEPERARCWIRWAALCVGLGLMTKGPIALLVPGAASFIAAIWTRRFRAWLRLAMDPVSWLIALGVAAPWYILQFQAQGIAFIRGFLGLHNIGRFTNTMHGFSAGPLYYPGWILVATLPWTLAVLSACGAAIRQVVGRSEKAPEIGGDRILITPELRLAWVVFFFVICFFSLSATKLPHYGFYGLSGLIVVVAVYLAYGQGGFFNALLAGCLALTTLFTLTLASLPLWLGEAINGVRDPYYQEVLLDVAIQTKNLKWWFVSAALAALGAIVVSLKSGRLGLLLAGGVGALTLHGLVVPAVIQSLRGPIREVAAIIRALPEDQRARVVTWRLTVPSLSFESLGIVRAGTPDDQSLVALHAKDLTALRNETACKRGSVVVDQVGIALVDCSAK